MEEFLLELLRKVADTFVCEIAKLLAKQLMSKKEDKKKAAHTPYNRKPGGSKD